ncbi:hypothetical protein LTR53_008330, partial [Teratosphaeriaceae sp. CCFEE 6253]
KPIKVGREEIDREVLPDAPQSPQSNTAYDANGSPRYVPNSPTVYPIVESQPDLRKTSIAFILDSPDLGEPFDLDTYNE